MISELGTQGDWAVRWSAWLGGEYVVKSILLSGAGLCFAVALAIEIHIIRQISCEKKEAKRKQCENPSEINNPASGNLGEFRSAGMEFRAACRHLKNFIALICFNPARDVFLNFFNARDKYFGFTHKCGEPPNDPSSATAADKAATTKKETP